LAGTALAFLVLAAAAVPAFAQQKILLWVPDRTTNNLGEYEITPSSGALSPFPPKPTSFSEFEVVISPNLKFLYVAENGGINIFKIDPSGSVVTAPTTITGNVQGLAFNAAGTILYASISSIGAERLEAYSVDQGTGALTAIPAATVALSPKLPRGLASDGNGHLFVAIVNDSTNVGYVSSYTINPNGTLTAIGNFSTGGVSGLGPNRLVINPAGTLLYSSDTFDHAVSGFTIAGNGALTLVGGPVPIGGGSSQPLGLAINPGGNVLLVTDNIAATANIYSFTIGAGGVLTAAPGSPFNTGGATPTGITIEPTGANVFVSNSAPGTVARFALNGTTGVLSSQSIAITGAGSPQFLLARFAPPPLSTVPAVSTWMLALLGMLLAASSVLVYRRAYRRS
jgi:6-phosphogluconolactonase (cycloisomerase 2 family)